jgi:uncharacterized protein (TIGR02246 family)
MLGAEIDASNARFVTALAAGDAAAAVAVYAADGTLVAPAGDVIRGREAIERFWRSGIDLGLRTAEYEALDHCRGRELAFEFGRCRLHLENGDGPPKTELGSYLVVYAREDDGSWRRAVDMFTTARDGALSPRACPQKEEGT